MVFPGVLLKAHGLRASKKRGQNFLTQPSTAKAIALSACINSSDWVLEIGAGLGALTTACAPMAQKVIAVEVDHGVFPVLQNVLDQEGITNVEAILQDALTLDWSELAQKAGSPFVVVGNLPYSISSPLLFKLLDAIQYWRSATLMVQKEVADRLIANPGTKDYGRMSVLIQTFCDTGQGLSIGPDQFFPKPNVASKVVHLVPRKDNLAQLEDQDQKIWFTKVVKAAFSQRRKTLLNSVSSGLKIDKAFLTSALESVDILPGCRAETLTPQEFGAIAKVLKQ